MRLLLTVLAVFLCTQAGAEDKMRVWRAVGRFRVEAAFVEYDAGVVKLRKRDGELIGVRVEDLTPRDRDEVMRLAGDQARGVIPAAQIAKPTGREPLRWSPIVRGETWPDFMPGDSKEALQKMRRTWRHVETEHFILHYQQVTYARWVARLADYLYQYIAADLPGFRDRVEEKSHIVVLRNREDWQEFLRESGAAPEWAAAYVQGMIMYLQDAGDTEANAATLAHEMSHLVLNRFFARSPPLWLNEGLAEWYGNIGYAAFRGQQVNPGQELGEIRQPLDLSTLIGLQGYPADPDTLSRFYQTSRHLVGMLMLRRDQPEFVRFLKAITVEGRHPLRALLEVYEIDGIAEWQAEFTKFLDEY